MLSNSIEIVKVVSDGELYILKIIVMSFSNDEA